MSVDRSERKTQIRILILRLSSIGDIILTTPLVFALRNHFPEARIDFFIKSTFSDLMRHNPHIDHLYEFSKGDGNFSLRNWKKFFKDQSYDWIIDIHGNLRSKYLRGAAKTWTTYSKRQLERTILIRTGLDLYKEKKPVYLRYFEALKNRGPEYRGQTSRVFVPESVEIQVQDRLMVEIRSASKKLSRKQKKNAGIAILVPSASWKNKQWKPEGFAALAQRVWDRFQLIPVFLGGPGDEALVERVRGEVEDFSIDFTGKFSLLESAALLSHASIVVCNDSGMLHMAQARGAPVVAIFGPTTEHLGYFPFPEKSAVVQRMDVPCRPCTHNGLNYCPKGHHNCMEKIEVKDVEEKIALLLTKNR